MELRELRCSSPPGTYIRVGKMRIPGVCNQTDSNTPIFCPPSQQNCSCRTAVHLLISLQCIPFKTFLSNETASVGITSGFSQNQGRFSVLSDRGLQVSFEEGGLFLLFPALSLLVLLHVNLLFFPVCWFFFIFLTLKAGIF